MTILKAILGSMLLMAPADAKAENGGSVPGGVLELVRFRLEEGYDEGVFLAAAKGTEGLLAAQAGFVSRRLVSDGKGGWLDMVEWSSLDAAQRGAEQVMADATFAPFMAMIDPASVQMEHLPIRWQMGD
jgi:hypothetical protein